MPVVIACPTCQQKVRVNENLLGKIVKCPQCKNPFTAVDPNALQTTGPMWEPPPPQPNLDFSATPPYSVPTQEEEFDVGSPGPSYLPPESRKTGGTTFVDYLLFRRMVTPSVIIVLFYIGVVIEVIGGLFGAVSGILVLFQGGVIGLALIVGALFGTLLAILLLRIYCEVVMVLFRILDNLRQINDKTQGPV